MTTEKKTRGRKPAKPKVAQEVNEFPSVEEKQTIKVVEVETETIEVKKEPVKNKRLQPVFVNGVERMMTKFAYNAIKKDPNKEVELPKDSPFIDEPCKGC